MFWIFLTCLGLLILYLYRVRLVVEKMNAHFEQRLEERMLKARELHDILLQTVQGSKMVADDALAAGMDQARMREALSKLSKWLAQAISEGRAVLETLDVTLGKPN